MPPNILLHGSGAVGTIYIYLLQKAGCEVTAVCRSNYDAAIANGFTIDSAIYGKDIHITPSIVRTPTEAANKGTYDYVVVCTKALPEAKTAEVIAPAVTAGRTTIVLIQNGIGIENEYRSRFPENPLLSCVVYLPTTQTAPGHIQMGPLELLEIGTYPAGAYRINPAVAASADTFFSLVQKGGSNVHFYPEIQEQRWSKLIINSSWNPICALTLNRDVAFLASCEPAHDLVMGVMNEVVTIAQAAGYSNVTAQTARGHLEHTTSRLGQKGIEPSMLVDVLWARRMEVEVILGNPVRIARIMGVSVPRMETLYALAKALDDAIALRQPGKSLCGDERGVKQG